MSKQFWSGFAVAVIALAGVSTYAYWGSTLLPDDNEPDSAVIDPTTMQFSETLRNKFIEEKGHPIEGFEPWMFMEVYAGLKAEDFDGVDALIGLYRVEGGEVVYDLNGEEETHSAARAISDEGMSQLLYNVAERLELDLAGDLADDDASGTLEQIVVELEKGSPGAQPPAGGPAQGRVDITGTIVCLPKKGDGPHTMECAYGLRADSGKHYGLTNLFEGQWPWPLDVSDRARIEGFLTAPQANTSYDIVGTIDVSTFEKL